jgi:hypothetical protein
MHTLKRLGFAEREKKWRVFVVPLLGVLQHSEAFLGERVRDSMTPFIAQRKYSRVLHDELWRKIDKLRSPELECEIHAPTEGVH